MNFTRAAVLVFIIVLLFAAADAWSADGPKLALGHTAANSSMTTGEVGYEVSNWEVTAGIIGAGSTKNGYQDTVKVFSVSKLVRPDWCLAGGCNYYRIGAARVTDSPLVGPFNFRLGIGMDWGIVALEYFHYSSAGIFETNTGIDGIQLRLNIPIQ